MATRMWVPAIWTLPVLFPSRPKVSYIRSDCQNDGHDGATAQINDNDLCQQSLWIVRPHEISFASPRHVNPDVYVAASLRVCKPHQRHEKDYSVKN